MSELTKLGEKKADFGNSVLNSTADISNVLPHKDEVNLFVDDEDEEDFILD